MIKITRILLCLLVANVLHSQVFYSGKIGEATIECKIEIDDSTACATYLYTKYNEPINLKGKVKYDTLTLIEKKEDSVIAILVFPDFNKNKSFIEGLWINVDLKFTIPILLTKTIELKYGDSITLNREIIQSTGLQTKYIRFQIKKTKLDEEAILASIHIYDKKSKRLLQSLPVECCIAQLDDVEIEDYNFDGKPDFSVFEAFNAGPNTSRVYYLFNPVTNKFFKSSFAGTSLDFDFKKKRIYEHNSCCGGSQHYTAVYKVVKNKMKILEEHCYKHNEEKGDMIEVKLKECR